MGRSITSYHSQQLSFDFFLLREGERRGTYCWVCAVMKVESVISLTEADVPPQLQRYKVCAEVSLSAALHSSLNLKHATSTV